MGCCFVSTHHQDFVTDRFILCITTQRSGKTQDVTFFWIFQLKSFRNFTISFSGLWTIVFFILTILIPTGTVRGGFSFPWEIAKQLTGNARRKPKNLKESSPKSPSIPFLWFSCFFFFLLRTIFFLSLPPRSPEFKIHRAFLFYFFSHHQTHPPSLSWVSYFCSSFFLF